MYGWVSVGRTATGLPLSSIKFHWVSVRLGCEAAVAASWWLSFGVGDVWQRPEPVPIREEMAANQMNPACTSLRGTLLASSPTRITKGMISQLNGPRRDLNLEAAHPAQRLLWATRRITSVVRAAALSPLFSAPPCRRCC